MNAISLSSLTSPATAANSTVDVSAHAASSAMPFQLPSEEQDSQRSNKPTATAVGGLTAEKAQPLMESLEAQLSYRMVAGSGQNGDQPRANLASTDVPTQGQSSVIPTLSSTTEAGSSNAEGASTRGDAPTAEEAQPLRERLEAQLSYRERVTRGQDADRLAADTRAPSSSDLPRSDLILSLLTHRESSEQVADDNVIMADNSHQPDHEMGSDVANLFFFQLMVDRALTVNNTPASLPLTGADNAASQALSNSSFAFASAVTSPAGGSTTFTANPQPTAADQSVLTLPLTLTRDQTGYAQPLVSALGEHLSWQITQQHQRVELQLHPAELGAMTITLHMNANTLQLHIHAEVPATQQLVQQTANELKESLTLSQGGQVAVDVSSQGHQQRRQAPQPQHPKVSANHLSLTDTQASATDHSILITL